MSVRTDVINLNVNVNGNAAQNELNNLKKRAADVKLEMEGLGKRTKEFADKKKELGEITTAMTALKQQIGITALSQKELVAELNKLKALKGSVVPFSDEFKGLQKQIDLVTNRLQEVKSGTQGFASVLGNISSQVKQFGLLTAAAFGFTSLLHGVKSVIENNARLGDSLAQLKIYMHGSSEDANRLYESLKQLDTRTSLPDLLDIATIVAKKGVAKEEIAGVTKALDQLFVVLGTEVGDPHEAVSSLVKLVNVYSEDHHVTADNISNIGAAIQKLTSTGVATGHFLIDFAERMAGVRGITGITIQSVLGLGAALEELGQRNESAATAAQKLVTQMFLQPALYAKAAGQSVEEFSKTLAKDPVEALIKVAGALKQTSSAPQELINAFSDMDIKGARVFGVLGDIAGNADYMRKRLKDASSAFGDQSSILDAFKIKNETLGATMDKLGKAISTAFVTSGITGILQGIFKSLADIITPAKTATQQFDELNKSIQSLEKNIVPLAKRYDELKAKTTLNAQEQDELKKIIKQVSDQMPFAVSSFDSYGNALALNTKRVYDFVDAEKSRLKVVNASAIKENQDRLAEINRQIEVAKADISQIEKKGTFTKVEVEILDPLSGSASTTQRDATKDEVANKVATYKSLLEQQKGYNAEVRRLNGETLQDQVDLQKKSDVVKKQDNAVDNSIGALRTKLQGEIEALKASYDKLNEADETGKAKNIAQRKALQDELTRLDGKETKGDKAVAHDYDKELKDADKFYKDLLKLREKAGLKALPQDDAEIEAVRQKYAELIARAKEFYIKKAIDKKKFDEEGKLIEEAQQVEIDALIKKHVEKRFTEDAEKEYEQSLADSAAYFDKQKIQAAQAFADDKITKVQYEQTLKQLDGDALSDRITIATDYSEHVKKAATDVTTFKKEQEKQTTQNLIDETNRRKELADSEKLAKAERNVITAKGKGVDAEVQAKKSLLQLQFELDTQYLDKKSELYQLKEAQLQDAIATADKEGLQKKIDNVMQYVGYFSSALTSINAIINNKENQQLADEKKHNDDKKKGLKKQLDDKLISQAQYDKKIQELDDAQTKRENEVKRQQAIRQKALSIFNAVISNAQAIVTTMSSVPFPFNIPLAIAQGIAGGLQIAAIKNEPLPELGTGDWIRSGDKHKDKSGGIPVKIERDEAVMNAAAMTDSDVVTATGTTAQITSALNSRKGRGVAWAGGALVTVPKWRSEPSAQINPGLVRYMATGGMGNGKMDNAESADNTELVALTKVLIQKQQENTEEIKNMKTRIHAVVSIKEYREEEAKYDAAKNASSIAS